LFSANKASTSLKKIDTTCGKNLIEEDSGFCEDFSNNNSVASAPSSGTWCKLAYWEECSRVGPLVTVTKPWIGVTGCCGSGSKKKPLPSEHLLGSSSPTAAPNKRDGEELTLSNLFRENERASDSTKRVRDKIGKGIILQRIGNQVWLFNVGQLPVFVNSPTLEDLSSASPESPFTVHKVLPGHTVIAFDFARSSECQASRRSSWGPYDPYAVRVSFGKGWGNNYQRQDATNCPCWLEILLVGRPSVFRPTSSSTSADPSKKQICSSSTASDR